MTGREKRILSVLPITGHPRDSKRISMLRGEGFAVEAVAFERVYHTGRMPDCPVEVVGRIDHGKYVQRAFRILFALPAIRRAVRRNDVVYASGPDMAYLAMLAGVGLRKPLVLEVGDIRELQVADGLKGKIVRAFDRFFVDHCALLVVTATDFVDVYYRQWLGAKVPALVIENKLEPAPMEQGGGVSPEMPQGRPLVDRPLRIGYFGGLRCEWSWQVLEALAKERPQDIEIVFAGLPMNPQDLPERVKKYPNMHYLGQYRSPQGLPALYHSVDLVWACYPPIGPQDWNLKWARPNRFYESCYFGKPMVSRVGSNDSRVVSDKRIGICIDDEAVEKAVESLCTIRAEDLEAWTENARELPRDLYLYTREAGDLAAAIRRL